jgi:hypothetical protein
MVGGLDVSPIVPPSRTFCPASPSLQWVPWASVPHLPGLQALARSPSVLCSATTATTPSRRPSVVPRPPIPWCDPLLHSQPGPRTTPPGWARRFSTPAPRSGTFPRSVVALPSSRVTPLKACPALRPRWCPQHSPYRVQDCCLPRLATCRLFPLVGTRGYPPDHNYTHFGAPSRGLRPHDTRLHTPHGGDACGFATDLLARR